MGALPHGVACRTTTFKGCIFSGCTSHGARRTMLWGCSTVTSSMSGLCTAPTQTVYVCVYTGYPRSGQLLHPWAGSGLPTRGHSSLDEMLWLELGTRVSSSYCSVDPCVFNRHIVLARHGTAMSFLAAPVKTQRKLNNDK